MRTRHLPLLLAALISPAAMTIIEQPSIAAASTPETVCGYLNSDSKRINIPGGYQTQDEETGRHIYISFQPKADSWSVATIDIRNEQNKSQLMVRIRPPCRILQARKAIYDEDEKLVLLQTLAPDLITVRTEDPVNPPVPPSNSSSDTKPPLLGIVDTGVNYLLPEFQAHIARTTEGRLLGYDFWDMDEQPFDSDPRQNPYYPFHHGTTVFSVLAAEAPDEAFAIYRFPALDMCRYKTLINHAIQAGIRILNISMGSSNIDDWTCFATAAQSAPSVLFIVSAGNNGRNIDNFPIYPAALTLDNLFVVSSADDFGRPGPSSNFGPKHVDVFVPAEQLPVIDHRGVRTFTGGTSYAAPRVAALAVRYLRANPGADTQQIIDFLQRRAISGERNISAFGWIPDPTDNYGF